MERELRTALTLPISVYMFLQLMWLCSRDATILVYAAESHVSHNIEKDLFAPINKKARYRHTVDFSLTRVLQLHTIQSGKIKHF